MEKHHTLLAKTYSTQILQPDPEMQNSDTNIEQMRHKFQELLWKSSLCDADAVYGKQTPWINSPVLPKYWGKSAALFIESEELFIFKSL